LSIGLTARAVNEVSPS